MIVTGIFVTIFCLVIAYYIYTKYYQTLLLTEEEIEERDKERLEKAQQEMKEQYLRDFPIQPGTDKYDEIHETMLDQSDFKVTTTSKPQVRYSNYGVPGATELKGGTRKTIKPSDKLPVSQERFSAQLTRNDSIAAAAIREEQSEPNYKPLPKTSDLIEEEEEEGEDGTTLSPAELERIQKLIG